MVMEKNYYRREGQEIPWLFARCWEDVALKEFNSWEVHEVCKAIVFLRAAARRLRGWIIASRQEVISEALPASGLYTMR